MNVTTKTLTGDQVADVYLDSPIWGNKKISKDVYDFGDNDTVGKHLKRSDIDYFTKPNGFGVFLGQHTIGWVVGIKNLMGSQLVSGLVYDSLDTLKQQWQLD